MSPGTSVEEKRKKIDFYTREIGKKYNLPVRFYEEGKTAPPLLFERVTLADLKKNEQKKSLEGKVISVIAIGSLTVSILFMSNNLTGNAIALNGTATNMIGAILFIIGLMASLMYFRRK